ncbi:MAG: 6-pyruvoyl tetrahydrobiopterin synthase [Sphingobacteriaceae bacterium]|nr:6-pyruvoyl tetrahydrobiopterin synthase [Sphingobacteriaceae bacterium]
MIYITRKEHFNAAHKLFNPAWSEEQNNATFGKCANKNWHGHNYELFVTVKGEINPDTGFVVNLKDLSTVIRTDVTEILDHKNLNLDVKGMPIMPSTENVAIFIWNILAPKIKEMGAALHCIKLFETDSNYVEYYGE